MPLPELTDNDWPPGADQSLSAQDSGYRHVRPRTRPGWFNISLCPLPDARFMGVAGLKSRRVLVLTARRGVARNKHRIRNSFYHDILLLPLKYASSLW